MAAVIWLNVRERERERERESLDFLSHSYMQGKAVRAYDSHQPSKGSASAGSRTRIDCLEGNHANRYTTDAVVLWAPN